MLLKFILKLQELLELISDYIKVADITIIYKSHLLFLYTSNKQMEFEI